MAKPIQILSPNPVRHDSHRRQRTQERIAVGLAAVVLVVTVVTAGPPVAGGTVPPVSHTGDRVDPAPPLSAPDDPCRDLCRSEALTAADVAESEETGDFSDSLASQFEGAVPGVSR